MMKAKIKRLALGGMLSAVILVMTIGLHLPVPATGGYVHLGDGFIFLTAAVLGPYAALAAGIGSALADLLGGYFIYIPATFIIKATMGLIAGKFGLKSSRLRRLIVFVIAELTMVIGYFAFEWILYGAAAALGAVVPNLIQGAFGVILGLVLTEVLSGISAKKKH